MLDYVRLNKIRTGYVRLGQVRLDNIRFHSRITAIGYLKSRSTKTSLFSRRLIKVSDTGRNYSSDVTTNEGNSFMNFKSFLDELTCFALWFFRMLWMPGPGPPTWRESWVSANTLWLRLSLRSFAGRNKSEIRQELHATDRVTKRSQARRPLSYTHDAPPGDVLG